MRTRHYIAIGLATVAVTAFLFATSPPTPLPHTCKVSDLIAVVEITATNRAGASKSYQAVATAKVIETFKGRINGATFMLDFDNGLGCPNVWYARGERCLVFATKLPTGHFATYNTSHGKFIVTNDTVLGWTVEGTNTLDDVRKEIRKHVL